MKRILSIDGGGLRGLFSLQLLARIEDLLRQETGRPDLVLADVFDFFAGTSTGGIIAAALCWGMNVADVERLYVHHGSQMFARAAWYQRWRTKYRGEALADLFRRTFSEDGAGHEPAKLGTNKLRKLLLLVMRNATTGSPWPVTNNPAAKYNDTALDDCNLNLPLWQLLRASTAAPSYFAPETVSFGGRPFLFVDGGMTPFNNPTLITVLTATLPCYRIGWPATREALHVVSVGTGTAIGRLPNKRAAAVNLFDVLSFLPPALIGSCSWEQDLMCRVLGDCVYGAPLDSELDRLDGPSLLAPAEQKFSYVRYDARFDAVDGLEPFAALKAAKLDDLRAIPMLQAAGKLYAERHVRREHLFPRATYKGGG